MNVLDDNRSLLFAKGELQALLTYASRDSTRPHLFGISICPRLGVVFAVDGVRALRRQCAKFGGRDLILDPVPIREAIKVAKSDTPMALRFEERKASLSVGACTFSVDYLKDKNQLAKPPAIDKVFRERRSYSSEVSFNADLFAESVSVAKLLACDNSPIVTMASDIEVTGQILILFDFAPEWSAVVMPARGKAKRAIGRAGNKKAKVAT